LLELLSLEFGKTQTQNFIIIWCKGISLCQITFSIKIDLFYGYGLMFTLETAYLVGGTRVSDRAKNGYGHWSRSYICHCFFLILKNGVRIKLEQCDALSYTVTLWNLSIRGVEHLWRNISSKRCYFYLKLIMLYGL